MKRKISVLLRVSFKTIFKSILIVLVDLFHSFSLSVATQQNNYKFKCHDTKFSDHASPFKMTGFEMTTKFKFGLKEIIASLLFMLYEQRFLFYLSHVFTLSLN